MGYSINIRECGDIVGEETPDWSLEGNKLPVYLVPITKLFYNDENGRIATLISSDLDTDPSLNYDELEIDEFNRKIHGFIKNANSPESFKRTYEDVKAKGQIRPGVILNDGRIVSGNRRFTVLRELYQETAHDKYAFFKCFIIDKNPLKEDDRKYIKTIERLTQFGVDEKVDYDPIARLVDVYNDLIGPKRIWTIEEYTKKLSLKKKNVELMYNKAKIMADFLEYINKPCKFHIARIKKLDGPIQELCKVYRNIQTNEWNRIRPLFYLKLNENGDRTRDIRDIVRLYSDNKKSFDELVSKCNEDIEERECKTILSNTENSGTQDLGDYTSTTQDRSDYFGTTTDLSGPISEAITGATYQNTIDRKRREKINKIFSSFEEIIGNFTDVYKQMNEAEKSKVKERKISLEHILQDFED